MNTLSKYFNLPRFEQEPSPRTFSFPLCPYDSIILHHRILATMLFRASKLPGRSQTPVRQKRFLLLLAGLAVLLAGSGHAYAQTSLQLPSQVDSIFVFYSDYQITQSALESVLGPAIRYIPDIWMYNIPDTDLTYMLQYLSNKSAISLDGHPLQRAPDVGNFVLTYNPNPNSEYEQSAREWLMDNELLEQEIGWLNENFRLPHDVNVVAAECGVANAFYYPDTSTVGICYEFIDELFDMWYRHNEDDLAGADDFAYDVTVETLYHEMGHAILDIYKLPFTGKEENVADQFAAVILSYTYDDDTGHNVGQNMMLNVALNYQYMAQDRASDPETVIPYWGVHGLDEQRSYNILCYAYGADAAYNQDLVEYGLLPEERAVWCEDEYEQIEYAFAHMLSYYTNGFFD